MVITWLGHSSFLIEGSSGKKIITDPFNGTVGYKLYESDADVVTISHNHFDHNYTEKIKGNPRIISVIGSFDLEDIKIKGIKSYHDNVMGSKRGDNIIYIIEMDGYRLCHLGDLGYVLDSAAIKELGLIDVLFIPVGGNYTLDNQEASELAKLIKSHIVIPMHYKTTFISFPISGMENFLLNMKNCEKITDNLKLESKLMEYNIVKILPYNN